MKKLLNMFSIFVILLSSNMKAQDFYSSMTKADHVEATKSLKFTTKLNTNHVSAALKIDPSSNNFDAEIKKYINGKINVTIDGNTKPLVFTGSQVKGESVWVYFEANNVSQISTLRIKNNILDVFPKQVNIVNVSYKGNQKNMTFQKGKEVAEVAF